MKCPICKAESVTAAHILGHGGKGVAKTISKADRLGRSERMKALNAKRRAEPENVQDHASDGA
mgnify:CR=1 FL=1